MTSILKLLPPSLKRDPFVVASAEAFEIQMLQLREEFEEVCNFVDLTTNNEQLIDFLAYEKHVDFYENLTIEEKRNVVKNSLKIHAKKGTEYALLRIFELLNMRGEIKEWFDYGGDPYRFKIDILDVENRGLGEQEQKMFLDLINKYKNNRSWLESIRVYLTVSANNYHACSTIVGLSQTVHPYTPREIVTEVYAAENAVTSVGFEIETTVRGGNEM